MFSLIRTAGTVLGIVLLALVALAACSDPTGTESHVGTYDMQSFRGSRLPAGDAETFVRSGELTLRADGTFAFEVDRDYCGTNSDSVCEEGEGDPELVTADGNYALSGIFLTLPMGGGDALTGRVLPGYILMDDGDPGSVWILRE